MSTADSEPRLFTRRRLASIVLAVGAALLLVTVVPAVPRDRGVELRLTDSEAVTSVELIWLSDQGHALQGTSLHYAKGAAPSRWTVQTELPDGDYTVEATVHRGTARASTRQLVRVEGDDPITVTLP